MTRVLHTLWSADFGGIERLAIDLAVAQREIGIDAAFLFGVADGSLIESFRESGIPILSAEMTTGWDRAASKRDLVGSMMKEFDVIHMHVFTPMIANCAGVSGKPVIFTDHGNYGLGRKWTLRDRAKRLLQRRFFREHVDFVSCNSEYTRQLALKHFKLDPPTSRVVYNGIDLSSRHQNTFQIPDEFAAQLRSKFVVGTTSRLAGFKRVDRLIAAFFEFQKRREDVLLLIVGDGPLRDEFEDQTRKLGIASKTVFAGFQRDVAAFQNAMDVCVFPSAGEPFGLVAVETLALGKPTVVMSDGGGIIEIIGSLSADDVVEDVEALGNRLATLYDSVKKTNESARRDQAAERIEHSKSFDISTMAARFSEIYTDLTGKPSSAKPQEMPRC
ncbi:MAG: glycosyltransferase family 4 protein [Rubripirellula sp.]